MSDFVPGQRIIRDDGLTATFIRYTPMTGIMVVRYDYDSAPEREAREEKFRARDATQPTGQGDGQ